MSGKKTVDVAFANENPTALPVEVVKEWKPTKITRMGSYVFFDTGDGTFVSMKRKDFSEIYGL